MRGSSIELSKWEGRATMVLPFSISQITPPIVFGRVLVLQNLRKPSQIISAVSVFGYNWNINAGFFLRLDLHVVAFVASACQEFPR